jgi:hypothetical protein
MQSNAMCVANCATPVKKKREWIPPPLEIVAQTVQDDLSVRGPRIRDQEAEHNARPTRFSLDHSTNVGVIEKAYRI